MLYILWGFLNFFMFVFILFLFVKGVTLIQGKIGMGAAVIFVFAVLAFRPTDSESDNREPNSNQTKTWKFTSPDSLAENSNAIILINMDSTSISKYCLYINYGKDKQMKRNMATSATTWTTGFECGTSWKPLSIIVNQTGQNDKFEYEVDGTVKWKFLGFTVYSQPKKWKGDVILK